jgi:transposase-like protein
MLPRGLEMSKLTPEQRDEIAQSYAEGSSIAGLSKNYGICKRSVKWILRARGVEIRPYTPQQPRPRKRRASPKPVHERWATGRLETAINKGEVKRSCTCEDCGDLAKTHGHHDDYNFPLVVRWLCPKCHWDWHSKHVPTPSHGQPSSL